MRLPLLRLLGALLAENEILCDQAHSATFAHLRNLRTLNNKYFSIYMLIFFNDQKTMVDSVLANNRAVKPNLEGLQWIRCISPEWTKELQQISR